MKKVAAISIELKDGYYLCIDMEEYHKFKEHLKRTKQKILAEILTIIDLPETLEELTQ